MIIQVELFIDDWYQVYVKDLRGFMMVILVMFNNGYSGNVIFELDVVNFFLGYYVFVF